MHRAWALGKTIDARDDRETSNLSGYEHQAVPADHGGFEAEAAGPRTNWRNWNACTFFFCEFSSVSSCFHDPQFSFDGSASQWPRPYSRLLYGADSFQGIP